ncbi:MAG: hypothetical protein K2X77_27590 [Candidatus Obscuribacterales bacterium]|jgi:hypothetical protein|nr:hypothetical protein [Candidatus Obscuribacterales bacterium]
MEGDQERIPKTQLESDRSAGSGRPPSDTAIGLTGDPDPEQYKVGQRLKCRVIEARTGGYAVLIVQDGTVAFLRTNNVHETGSFIIGEFRHWQSKS